MRYLWQESLSLIEFCFVDKKALQLNNTTMDSGMNHYIIITRLVCILKNANIVTYLRLASTCISCRIHFKLPIPLTTPWLLDFVDWDFDALLFLYIAKYPICCQP